MFSAEQDEALWRWLWEWNIPDINLLQALYEQDYHEVDLPYGRSASISLTRCTKQGDELSPLLFGLICNALQLALKTTGVGHRTITGLRTPASGFADDLVIVVVGSAAVKHVAEGQQDQGIHCRLWSSPHRRLLTSGSQAT